MKLQGAIFDQDGLLFDTEVIFQRCWRQAGTEMGVDVPTEMTLACRGCGRRELAEVIRPFFPSLDVEAYINRALALSFETQITGTPILKPGVREMLAKCRAYGLRTAIATSSRRELAEHNIHCMGLESYFDVIVSGADVQHGKPAPDIFLLAARRLGVPSASCLVFEDAFSGIRAAHAAGCQPVLIPDCPNPEGARSANTIVTPDEIRALCVERASLLDALDLFD